METNTQQNHLDFADIECNKARNNAVEQFAAIVEGLPYRAGQKVLKAIRERIIIDNLGADSNE